MESEEATQTLPLLLQALSTPFYLRGRWRKPWLWWILAAVVAAALALELLLRHHH